MPKTKLKRTSKIIDENVKPTKAKLQQESINCYFKAIEDDLKLREESMEAEFDAMMLKFESKINELFLEIPSSELAKTIGELKITKPDVISISDTTSFKSFSSSTRSERFFNKTGSVSKQENSLLKSKRFSAIKKAKKIRQNSSALSNSRFQPAVRSTLQSAITPLYHNSRGLCFKTVTPKIKPNTSQVILRRPKQGEVALSMEGSPLMVGSISNDVTANVNIPLQDGRILAIQPRHGLSLSELPNLDKEMQRQVETLRDNLIKVCGTHSHF